MFLNIIITRQMLRAVNTILGTGIKNYLQLRCNVGMRLRHHGVLIGSITLIITVGFRRSLNLQHRHLYPRPSGQESKRCDVQENVSYESNEEENDVLAWMKISNLDANNIRSFDRVQAVMCRCVNYPELSWGQA